MANKANSEKKRLPIKSISLFFASYKMKGIAKPRKAMSKNRNEILAELERTVTERQDCLFRFAYMRIGNRTDAEDVVQDVFLRLLRKLQDGGKVEDMELYLMRSVSNACNDFFRRKRPDFQPIDTAAGMACCDDDRQMQEEFRRINRLFDGLPYEQAETIRLHCIDGLTFGQIAKVQGVVEATAKSRYRYAMAHIHEQMKNKREER